MLSRPCYCSEWAPVVAHYLSQSVTFFRLKTLNSCFKVCLHFQNYDHYSANYVEYPHRPPTPPSPSDRSASPPPQHREPGKFRACFLAGPNDCSQVCPDSALKRAQVVDVYARIEAIGLRPQLWLLRILICWGLCKVMRHFSAEKNA